MGDRFNSFYSEKQHPYIEAMVGVLAESDARQRRPNFTRFMYIEQEQQYQKDIETIQSISKEMLESRRRNPTDRKDLLNALMFNKDPKTGERLGDDSIIRNMVTFLIAGKEFQPLER